MKTKREVQTEQYSENRKQARLFEDFASEILYDHGLVVGMFRSTHYQFTKGESRSGIEFKLDRRWRKTGNLYIETHERSRDDLPFVNGGIMRDDNTLIWCIGDFGRFWLFAKKHLRQWRTRWHVVETTIRRDTHEFKTSKGFLMPLSDTVRFAIGEFKPNPEKLSGVRICTKCGTTYQERENMDFDARGWCSKCQWDSEQN